MSKVSKIIAIATICFASSSFALTSKLNVSCSGGAYAALSEDASESDVLNRWLDSFSIELRENESLFIGALVGGCGKFGCPSFLRSSYRIFMDSNAQIHKETLNDGEIVEINPGAISFRVLRHNYVRLTLDCLLTII